MFRHASANAVNFLERSKTERFRAANKERGIGDDFLGLTLEMDFCDLGLSMNGRYIKAPCCEMKLVRPEFYSLCFENHQRGSRGKLP